MPRSPAPTRQAILDGAYRLFRRKGFVRVSMDEIAASAAVTKRTLYYHFTSKDLLLAEVLEAQHALALAASGRSAKVLPALPRASSINSLGTSPSGRTRRDGPAQDLPGLSSSLPISVDTPLA
jgi:AcrR family transcriptional regulator